MNRPSIVVHGDVADGFEAVAEAFRVNFLEHEEVGAAFSLYLHGCPVVDIWGGQADPVEGKPWQQDSIQLIFSAIKAVTATCMLMLSERGQLDLDAPVARYWPEFGVNGKEEITSRMVLTHRAGMAAVDGSLSLDDVFGLTPLLQAIAAQEPNWPPGAAHGYHARTFGWILGEVIRRVTGVSAGAFIQREISEPLGLDLWVGLPPEELGRCTRVIPPDASGPSIADLLGEDSLTVKVMTGPSGLFAYNEMWNRPELLQAEMPSSNGVCDARSLAKFYAALSGQLKDLPLLQPDTLAEACAVQSSGEDKVVMINSVFGSGFALPPFLAPGVGPASFGHSGAGGSLGFADPEAGISFGYVMNKMRFDPEGDPRSASLIKACYQCL